MLQRTLSYGGRGYRAPIQPRRVRSTHDHAHPHHKEARALAGAKGGEPAKPVYKKYTGARPWVIEHG